jgi:hypothetical protein
MDEIQTHELGATLFHFIYVAEMTYSIAASRNTRVLFRGFLLSLSLIFLEKYKKKTRMPWENFLYISTQ